MNGLGKADNSKSGLAWRSIEDIGLIFGSVGVFSDFVLSASNLVID